RRVIVNRLNTRRCPVGRINRSPTARGGNAAQNKDKQKDFSRQLHTRGLSFLAIGRPPSYLNESAWQGNFSYRANYFASPGWTNVSDATGVIRHLNIDFARELGETRAWSFRIRALSGGDTKALENSDWRLDSESRRSEKKLRRPLGLRTGGGIWFSYPIDSGAQHRIRLRRKNIASIKNKARLQHNLPKPVVVQVSELVPFGEDGHGVGILDCSVCVFLHRDLLLKACAGKPS